MSPQFLVIGYYTNKTNYQSLSERLKQSIESLNLPHFLKGIDDIGSWEKNTHYKAEFILECLNRFNNNLLYVDVDAIFRGYPTLLDQIDCDIAYRTENFRWRKNEALSGTIYLANNEKTKKFVKRWIEINNSCPAERYKPETWEQKNMQRAQRDMSELKYFNLPAEYTFITDHTRTMYPGLKPIIEHFQESRNVHKKR